MASKIVYIFDTLKALDFNEMPCKYNASTKEFVFPTIESKDSSGKKTVWTIRVSLVDKDDVPQEIPRKILAQPAPKLPGLRGKIIVDSGRHLGKTRKSHPTYVDKGKSSGKSNSTNV